MKKMGWVMLVLCLLLSFTVAAFAQDIQLTTGEADEEWLRFTVSDEALAYTFGATDLPPPPPGLEKVYQWMEADGGATESVFVRMPKGRVLVNLCRTDLGEPVTPESLCALWPEMAKAFAKHALYVNDDPGCASVSRLGGQPWMHVETMAVMDGEDMMSVEVEGFANCDAGTLVEVWVAAPARATYLYDETASAELAQDMEAAEAMLATLRLPGAASQDEPTPEPTEAPQTDAPEKDPLPEATEPPSDVPPAYLSPSAKQVEYRDANGRFTLMMPENALVIEYTDITAKQASAEKDVKDPERLALYRYWLKQAKTFRATLLVDPNYQNALLLIISPNTPPQTLDDIEAMEPDIAAALSKELDNVKLDGKVERGDLSGEPIVILGYEAEYKGTGLYLLITAATNSSQIHEINLWGVEAQDNTEWSEVLTNVVLSVEYGDVSI